MSGLVSGGQEQRKNVTDQVTPRLPAVAYEAKKSQEV
jgi:hypothetical protein